MTPLFSKTYNEQMEAALDSLLRRYFRFASLVIYFPSLPLLQPEYLAEEEVLLAPLQDSAALRLAGFDPGTRPIDPQNIASIIDLCCEILSLRRQMERDSETDLLAEGPLLEAIAQGISSHARNTACMGMLMLRWNNAADILKEIGKEKFDQIWKEAASIFSAASPPSSNAGRFGQLEGYNEFALILRATGRKQCQELAGLIIDALRQLKLESPLTGKKLYLNFSAGHVLYPQDLSGNELRLPPFQRVIILKERARLAARTAGAAGSTGTLAWAWLKRTYGRILSRINQNLVLVSLGKNADIQKGQRYHVADSDSLSAEKSFKAQLIIRNVSETESIAEIYHVDRADSLPAPGDRLILADFESQTFSGQAEFLAAFERERKHYSSYTLAITRYWPNGEQEGDARALLEQFSSNLANKENTKGLIGRYAYDSLIFFRPNDNSASCQKYFRDLYDLAQKSGLDSATGIFTWPMLNFVKSESELCALKALAYGQLLPPPHIGLLDALALTISADKSYSLGDELRAMKEYELALLLKPDEPATLNSLGVCMASLNRYDRAKDLFEKALAYSPSADLEAKILYNIGNVLQKENDSGSAMRYIRRCVRTDPTHIFAWIKYGSIFAQAGRIRAARAIFHHAERLAQNMPDISNTVRRMLARLESGQSKKEIARTLLHDALLRNPSDTASLLLLAETYMEEDPNMAEFLARKSIRLGGDGWHILANALACLGRDREAKEARARLS